MWIYILLFCHLCHNHLKQVRKCTQSNRRSSEELLTETEHSAICSHPFHGFRGGSTEGGSQVAWCRIATECFSSPFLPFIKRASSAYKNSDAFTLFSVQLSQNSQDLWKKCSSRKMCSFFSKTSVQNIYHSNKYSASYACDTFENAYRSSCKVSVWCQHNTISSPILNFMEKMFSGAQVMCRETDKYAWWT